MKVITSPEKYSPNDDEPILFLAGSIEQGTAIDWQSKVIEQLKDIPNIVVFNPRRKEWDSSWEQNINNPTFKEQVNWELDNMDRAETILMYFQKGTISPISLLEFGMYTRTGKLIVVCEEGFHRKGNVDIVCENYNIDQFYGLDEAIDCLKKYYGE